MRKRLAAALMGLVAVLAADWPRFRGPSGSGLGEGPEPPAAFGLEKNLGWRTAIGPGHSSPVICGGHVYLTSFLETSLRTHAVDARTGKTNWTRDLPRERTSHHHKLNNAASPTPSCDEAGVAVFFSDFGLAAWTRSGEPVWQVKLPARSNNHGMASSPVIADGRVLLVHAADTGSKVLAYRRDSGHLAWESSLSGVTYATPAVSAGQVAVLSTGELVSFDLETGKRRWWANGLPYQPKSSPVFSGDGRTVFFSVLSVEEKSKQAFSSFDKLLAAFDVDGDGRITLAEMRERKGPAGVFSQIDLDGDGVFTRQEHGTLMKIAEVPQIAAAAPAGRTGDQTGKFTWSAAKGVPNVASPILVNETLFLFKEGGILTSIRAADGVVRKEGRIDPAFGALYSSPVAAGGRIYIASASGKVAVVKADPDWEILAINDLGEDCLATPAVWDGSLFIRTANSLWRFGGVR